MGAYEKNPPSAPLQMNGRLCLVLGKATKKDPEKKIGQMEVRAICILVGGEEGVGGGDGGLG